MDEGEKNTDLRGKEGSEGNLRGDEGPDEGGEKI